MIEHAAEEVLLVVRKHWAYLIPNAFIALGPVIAIGLFWALPEEVVGASTHALITLLVPLMLFFVWLLIFIFWTNYYLDMLILTDRRIFYTAHTTLVSEFTREWDIDSLVHVNVRTHNVFETLFNYGTLEIEARGEEAAEIPGVPDPSYVSAMILRQDDRYDALKDRAQKQQELLKFVSHEVKGNLARSKAAFAAIAEGDYGPVSEGLETMAKGALAETQKGVESMMTILDQGGGADASASGTVKLDKHPFDLSATVRSSVARYAEAAAHKGLAITDSIDEGCTVVGDEGKLEQYVIGNLLENAIHYTLQGVIDVSLKRGANNVRLTVADSGVGMLDSDMAKLFTPGGRGERSREINKESTGYGLYIAKRLVEAHGGSVWARSDGPGQGSQFFVELPLL